MYAGAMRSLALAFLLLLSVPALAASPLVMPVAGGWIALDGPPCAARDDGDCAAANTRLGFELVPLDAFGRPADTCLNQPVMTPSEGVVVAVLDAYPNFAEAGQHRFDEYIVLGSLMHSSLKVAIGDAVAAGEIVARCGFSGASGRPALHVHMQVGRDILDADSTGLPMPFANLSVRTPGGCRPTLLIYRGQGIC